MIYNRNNSSAADPAVKDYLSTEGRGISQSMKRNKLFSSRSSLASLPECWFGVDPVAGVEHSGSISAATSAERSVASSDRWG